MRRDSDPETAARTRCLVTGSGGQLGRALVDALGERGCDLQAARHGELDIADRAAVRSALERLSPAPDVVFNAAAFTHVDRCESDLAAARAGNAEGPGILAEVCASLGTRLVHVSTDYVFAGDEATPRAEGDPTGPRSAYGRTKLEGERRVLAAAAGNLVVRTSWLFGRGRNFIGAILSQAALRRSGEARGPLRVVDDQTGRPTYAVDLAAALLALVDSGARGLYHVANDGIATWWELARFCLDEAGFGDLAIERIRTEDLDLPAPRPAWSILDCSRAAGLGIRMRSWKDAVRAYLRAEGALAGAGARADDEARPVEDGHER
jgi:dTDP-4-dehydrorhamnose reductase